MCEVTEADIPQTLIERLAEERSEHTIKKMRFTIYMYNCTPRNKIYSNYKTCTLIFFRRLEAQKRKERTEAHLYMTIQVVSNDNFYGHQGNDLFDPDRVNYRTFKVKKSCSISEFLDIIADNMVCISVH